MNTRQKAKYWKRRYLELASVPVPTKNIVSERKIETISYTKVVTDDVYRQALDCPELQRKILGDVIDEVAEGAKNFVDITVEKNDFTCDRRLTGRLTMLRPYFDYHDILAYTRMGMEE